MSFEREIVVGDNPGHTGPIIDIFFLPHTADLVTASADYSIKIWNRDGFQFQKALYGHKAPVNRVCFSEWTNLVIGAGEDNMLFTFDLDQGWQMNSPNIDQTPVRGVAAVPSRRVVVYGTEGGALEIIEPQYVTNLHRERYSEAIEVIRDVPGAGKVLVGFHDGRIRILDPEDWQELGQILLSSSEQMSELLVTPGGELIVTGDKDGRLRGRNLAEGNLVWDVQVSTQPLVKLALSPREPLLGVADQSGTITLWNYHEQRPVSTHIVGAGSVSALRFDPVSGDVFFAVGAQLSRWQLHDTCSGEKEEQITRILDKASLVTAFVVDRECNRIWVGTDSGELYTYQIPDGKLISRVQATRGPIVGIALLAGAERIAVHSLNEGPVIYNTDSIPPTRHVMLGRVGDAGTVTMASAPDGTLLAAGSANTITLWRDGTFEPIWTSKGTESPVIGLCFPSEGEARCWVVERAGRFVLWDVHSREPETAFALDREIERVAFNPQENTFLVVLPVSQAAGLVDASTGDFIWQSACVGTATAACSLPNGNIHGLGTNEGVLNIFLEDGYLYDAYYPGSAIRVLDVWDDNHFIVGAGSRILWLPKHQDGVKSNP